MPLTRSIENWVQEISDHSPITPYIWCWKVNKEKELDRASRNNDLIYILMNVEALSHKSGQLLATPKA